MKWFVTGDIDGFFGLAIDNLIQVLLIIGLCTHFLGFPPEFVFSKILPGIAVSLIIGNVYYSTLAIKLGRQQNRNDFCALPYGINTPAVFVYVFLIMFPVKLAALANGYDNLAAVDLAWKAGLVACLGSGIIEFLGAFIAEKIRKAAPRAALLSTLSGIALGFISMPFIYRTFAYPIIGFSTLAIIFIIYFGKVKFKGNLPGGLIAVVTGTLLTLIPGIGPEPHITTTSFAFYLPIPVLNELIVALQNGFIIDYISVIIPMGVFNILGSLQNIESAEAAGDKYPTAQALAINGSGSILAAFFGSCFPTTIYIGHPGWKGLGARAGYSTLNAVFITLLCLTGTITVVFKYVPLEAGMAIVLWIGIVITAQTFQATPRRHAPASVIGILIGVAAWGSVVLKTGVRTADTVTGGTINMLQQKEVFIQTFAMNEIPIVGVAALEQGAIFTAMIFSALTVYVIEKQFIKAATWSMVGAVFSALGLVHSHTWEMKDITFALFTPAWQWAIGYLAMATCFTAAKWITVEATTDFVQKKP